QGLLYHELDFNNIYVAKQTVNCVRHYSRPDIFSLQVNSKVNQAVVGTTLEAPFLHKTRFPALDEEP
ncbi:hypothetical protein C7974DRAFT_304941, partial [Boeremia exigua]|uniref:uncharacterized protein n=1 Tax=Boeremia exigua TaxID=749465 RepID=UPI001E8EE224